MSVTINILYKGTGDNALKFAREMEESGLAEKIRQEEGNLRYEYFSPLADPSAVLLIDCWTDENALAAHHKSEMMKEIILLREKFDLHMTVDRFESVEENPDDEAFIRR